MTSVIKKVNIYAIESVYSKFANMFISCNSPLSHHSSLGFVMKKLREHELIKDLSPSNVIINEWILNKACKTSSSSSLCRLLHLHPCLNCRSIFPPTICLGFHVELILARKALGSTSDHKNAGSYESSKQVPSNLWCFLFNSSNVRWLSMSFLFFKGCL